jgi:predicted Holliday junction resolvase-like endonuclease
MLFIVGVIIGALIVYALLSRRILRMADEKAEQIATRLFTTQKDQLEQSFNQTYMAKLEEWKAKVLSERIVAERADALDRARAVLKGKIGEQLAPLLPEFLELCNPSDARFIGSPIDYLIFRNMTCEEGQDLPMEIVLLDVKTGASAVLNKVQRRIQEAIEAGRVRFHTLRLEEIPPLPRAHEG